MRIIAGRFKGHRLCSFSADFIRPMTDRVKTSVFDTLYSSGGEPENRCVLDLFSGTGSLALEALSRGAKEVHLVDSSKKAIQIIRKNCQLLKIKSSVKIYQKDVFRFLSAYKGKSFELVFADPPFKKKWGKRILEFFISSQVAVDNTILVLEVSSQEDLPEKGDGYYLFAKKKFGDKQVLFFCLKSVERQSCNK